MTAQTLTPARDDALRIFMRPAWNAENPFTWMLAEALAAEGFAVADLGFGYRNLPAAPGTIFLHWPDEFFGWRSFSATWRAAAVLAGIRRGKARGQRLVWLVHNLEPHRRGRFRLPPLREAFFALVDGLVFLSEESRRLFMARYPRMARVPSLVVNHGHYLSQAIRPPQPSPHVAGRPVRLAYAGRVERYKAPDVLAGIVASLPAAEVTLVVAGACREPPLAAALEACAREAANVEVRLDYLDAEQMEAVVDAADAIVLPYRNILNSGSALYALSRGRPFVAPRLGSLVALCEQVGGAWVWLYDGDFTVETARAAIRWIRETPRPTLPDLSAFDWSTIGAAVGGFLREVSARRN